MDMTASSEALEGKFIDNHAEKVRRKKENTRAISEKSKSGIIYEENSEVVVDSVYLSYNTSSAVISSNGSLGVEGFTHVQSKEKTNAHKGFKYGCYLFVKRAFDIVSSGIVLLLLSWLILGLVFIKWLEDLRCPAYILQVNEVEDDGKKHKDRIKRADGKIFECKLIPDKINKKNVKKCSPIYVSKRVGKDGEIFNFHKIRSMCFGAEDMKYMLIDAGLNEADPPAFKMENDPRITKFGKFLRKTSLDELPQLWDIFIGKMSVVGPRPPIPCEVAEYTPEQKHRLDVKGGLLCLWQIQKDRNKITFDDWVNYDIEYIEKQSVVLDLKIIFKGLYMVLFDHSGE